MYMEVSVHSWWGAVILLIRLYWADTMELLQNRSPVTWIVELKKQQQPCWYTVPS